MLALTQTSSPLTHPSMTSPIVASLHAPTPFADPVAQLSCPSSAQTLPVKPSQSFSSTQQLRAPVPVALKQASWHVLTVWTSSTTSIPSSHSTKVLQVSAGSPRNRLSGFRGGIPADAEPTKLVPRRRIYSATIKIHPDLRVCFLLRVPIVPTVRAMTADDERWEAATTRKDRCSPNANILCWLTEGMRQSVAGAQAMTIP